jgi:hypothetical protein
MQLNIVELWHDMHFSPRIAGSITDTYLIKAVSSYELFQQLKR